jgi:hypothetical protein
MKKSKAVYKDKTAQNAHDERESLVKPVGIKEEK